MASNTLTAYETATATKTFNLVTTSKEQTVWRASGRSLGQPYEVQIVRKIGNAGQKTNDNVQLRVLKTELDPATGLVATAHATLNISVPRNASLIPGAQIVQMMSVVASLLNDGTAVPSTSANKTALVEGRDL